MEAPSVLQHPVVRGLYSGGEIELIAVVKDKDLTVLYSLEVPLEPLPVRHLTCHLLRELNPAGGVHILPTDVQPAPQLEEDTGFPGSGLSNESHSTGAVWMPVEHGFQMRLDGLRNLVGVEGVVVGTYTPIPILFALLVLYSQRLCCLTAFMTFVTNIGLHLPAVGEFCYLGLEGLIAGFAGNFLGVCALDFDVGEVGR